MRIAPCLLGLLALAVTASSQSQSQSTAKVLTAEQMRQMMADFEYWRAQGTRYSDVERRAKQLYPDRRNTPLRELNISDDEIREVEVIARKYLPRAMVNISPVVTDCPCEEGPACSAQVYVVATTADKARGIQLSRVKNRWGVGVVQDWWLRREAIVKQHTGNAFLDEYNYQLAVNELYEEFPVCTGQLVAPQNTAAATKAEGKK